MRVNKSLLFILLVFATGVAMLFADLLLMVFFGHSLSRVIFRFSVTGAVFLVIYLVVLGRNAGWAGFSLTANTWALIPI